MKVLRAIVLACFLLTSSVPAEAGFDWKALQARAVQQVEAWRQAAAPHLARAGEQVRARTEELAKRTGLHRYQHLVPSCRQALLVAGAAAAVTVGSVGYYNIPYRSGEWVNQGTASEPIWVPQVGSLLVVEQRSQTISLFRDPTLSVHDSSRGYGGVVFRNDRIEYRKGGELVAFTDPVSPYGRPYSTEFPIKVRIYDSQANPIGSLEEANSELRTNVLAVRFILRDADGEIVAQTGPFEETENAEPITQPWEFKFTNPLGKPGSTLTRRGMVWNRYITDSNGGEREADVRILVVLSAYKDYVDKNRQ